MSEVEFSATHAAPFWGVGPSSDGNRPELSIVLPIFNEEGVVDELHRRLAEVLATVGTTLGSHLRRRRVERWVVRQAQTTLRARAALSTQLLMTGILGEYIGRIYEEVKRRPLYVVAEEVNATRDRT